MVRDDKRSVSYLVKSNTPNEAAVKVAKDYEREVKGDGRMRSYIDDGWLTVEEYYEHRKHINK